MSTNTKIEWADHTFNPWIGCTQISPACDNCYAKAWDRRFAVSGHAMHWGAGVTRQRTKTWSDPVRWNKQHEAFFAEHGRRQRVFCASLADVFDNDVDSAWRTDLWQLIAATPNLDWLLLTKRIGNALNMLPAFWGNDPAGEYPWPNVWLGATICNQEEADRDIPKLLKVPAAKRFLSIEPLLSRVDLCEQLGMWWNQTMGCFEGEVSRFNRKGYGGAIGIDWVIVGGESGPNARPMHPDWARSLRDQCEAASVPFLFKQWGEWCPESVACSKNAAKTALYITPEGATRPAAYGARNGATTIQCVGKKAAGRLLDGREWNGVAA